MAITILFARPRYGKTALMTHLGRQSMFDKERKRKMYREIDNKNSTGFNLSKPRHPLCANYDIVGRKFGFSPRYSRRINPFRLGYANKKVATHFIEPFSVICITEGQKYLNSRMSLYSPDWQFRWYEQHGHNDYDILIDVQRPTLIDKNVRELANFIEILSKKTQVTNSGTKTIWKVRKFAGHIELEEYYKSGKKDQSTYTEETIIADYDVHKCYNHQMCKPKFYDGHLNHDFDTEEHEPLEDTFDGYIKYLQENDDELPKDFYSHKKAA